MLKRLRIENLAIIERCEIDFEPGLNIMTGETGAGKSIVIGALNLILGERASLDDIRSGVEQARVEAVFDLDDAPAARARLDEMGLAGDEPNRLIARRVLQAGGKSRHFINGSAVQLAEARAVTDGLVDLHGQHKHQSLLDADSQREALDAFGAYGDLLDECAARHAEFVHLRSRLKSLMSDERETEREKDMLRYQIDEIEKAALEPGEDESLDTERARLQNAEALRLGAAAALDLLYEGEECGGSAIQRLEQAIEEIASLARVDRSVEAMPEALGGARATIEDAVGELRDYLDAVEADPERLVEVEDRLDLIQKLRRKYGETLEAVLAEGAAMRERLDALENREVDLAETRAAFDKARAALGETAGRLRRARREAAEALTAELEKHLADLNMPDARCSIVFDAQESDGDNGVPLDGRPVVVGPDGADTIETLFSPNVGEAPRPLRKIASGGELSRVMLAIKSIMADRAGVPTLVFDEVDAGVSGATADRVGKRIETLARSRQIVCITHLPQIASRGATHFRVSKATRGGRTTSSVARLSPDERLDEIARLFSGERATPESREHARALLGGP